MSLIGTKVRPIPASAQDALTQDFLFHIHNISERFFLNQIRGWFLFLVGFITQVDEQ